MMSKLVKYNYIYMMHLLQKDMWQTGKLLYLYFKNMQAHRACNSWYVHIFILLSLPKAHTNEEYLCIKSKARARQNQDCIPWMCRYKITCRFVKIDKVAGNDSLSNFDIWRERMSLFHLKHMRTHLSKRMLKDYVSLQIRHIYAAADMISFLSLKNIYF